MEKGKTYKYNGQMVVITDVTNIVPGMTTIIYQEGGLTGPQKRAEIPTSEVPKLFLKDGIETPEVTIQPSKEKNTFKDMREILFETMRGVANKTIEAEDAKAISQLSSVIVASVKVELDFQKFTNDTSPSKALD
jgi:hypothetical protein